MKNNSKKDARFLCQTSVGGFFVKGSDTKDKDQKKSLRRFHRICRNFKEIPQLSKSDLVSILTELHNNFFSIAVSLSQAQYTPDPAFNEEKNKEFAEFYKSARRKAYEDWYYLGAIGATTSKEDMSDSFDCLGDKALIVQRRFLSHSKKKATRK